MPAKERVSVLIVVSVAVLVLAAVAWLLVPRLLPYNYRGFVMQPTKPVADFTLVAANNRPVKLSDFRGKLAVIYFGYTFCPDVCPTTMADLARALKAMGRKADNVRVIMITVDPERDTPESLGKYVANFDPRFVGLSGTPEQIATVATPLGIYYQKHAGTAATGYLVDHTATVAALDRDGYLRLVFPYGTPSEDIASDLTHLLD